MKDGDVRKQLKANNRRKGNDNGLQKQAKGDDGRETREEEQERDIINCPKTRYEDGVESRPSTSPSRSFPWRRDLPLAPPLAPPAYQRPDRSARTLRILLLPSRTRSRRPWGIR